METGENNSTLIESSNFNIALSEQYHLSLQIGWKSFSYTILNTKNLRYEYLESHEFESNSIEQTTNKITEIINNNDKLKHSFSSSSVAYMGFPNTLVPNKVYNEQYVKEMLELNTKVFKKIFTDDIKSQKAKLVYSVPEEIITIIETSFPVANCISIEKILIEQYNLLQDSKDNAYINMYNNQVFITIFHEGNLILSNIFKFTTKEDLLYYILFCFEQLKLSTEIIPVILFGNIETNDENYKLLYKYIRNISFGNNRKFNLADEFSIIDPHQYFGLFSQVLCA